MHKDEEYVRRAILAGAAGYLLKDSDTEELETGDPGGAAGEMYLSPAVSTHLIAGTASRRAARLAPVGGLTPRQLEVLRLIAEGMTTKAIARNLGISIKTVESHRTLLMERLGHPRRRRPGPLRDPRRADRDGQGPDDPGPPPNG